MYISKVNPTNICKTNYGVIKNNAKTHENPSVSKNDYSQLSFGCSYNQVGAVGLRKIRIPNQHTQEACTKFLSILRNLPAKMKMSEARFYSVGEEKIGYLIDKSATKKIQLCVKTNVENLKDWYNEDNSGTVLECIFDEKGLMKLGKLIQKKDGNKPSEIIFQHIGKEGRRITIDEKLYRPTVGKNDFWSLVPNPNHRYSMGEYNLSESVKDIPFSDLFLEMANNKTSVLLK